MDEIVSERLTSVREHFAEWAIDGLLIGSATNRRWLSGFTGSSGWLLITEEKALLGTDFRYWDQARNQSTGFELVEMKGRLSETLPNFVAEAGDLNTIGIEANYITIHQYEILLKVPDITWVKLEDSLELFREVKSNQEIESIREAAAITDTVMAQVNRIARPGMTENQLAWELEKRLRKLGASDLAFPIIVASGKNGARAHHEPGDRQLENEDTIIIDMGAKLNGYCSDLTRTFFLGDEPSAKFNEIFQVVLDAQEEAIRAIATGKSGKEIDSIARSKIDSAGYGKAFGHSLGHGVGLDIHENPRLSQIYDGDPLVPEMVVTVEPGIYLPDWGGVRIEDLILVTSDGNEPISQCPKQPIIPVNH
jgi:Xaa-Pro aminopeptidase